MKPFVPNTLPLDELDWNSLFQATVQANRALARFEGSLIGVPNPDVLLSPLTAKEAVLSSKIEGTQATLGEVFRYEAGEVPEQEARREDIFEILNYRKALFIAREELQERPFSLNLLKRLHGELLNSVRGRDKSRGEFRRMQNWIGGTGTSIEHAQFVPPEPSIVMASLDNWEKYYHYKERDQLVQLAIIHAQFEIIHPFLDGNGRLGRILVPLFLYEKEVLPRPVFYVSGYLEEHREEYIDALRQLDGSSESWVRWILFFLQAIISQAQRNMETAKAMMELYERLKNQVIELTHSQYAVPLLDAFFQQPIFKSTQITLGPNGPSGPTINTLLRTLREAGMLQVLVEGRGRRAQVLALGELVVLCET